jgi:hypothetical protein
VACGIGREVAVTEDGRGPVGRCRRSTAPAEDRLHAKHQLGGGERLRQVVVGAVLEAGDPIDRRAARRQDEDRCSAGLLVTADGPDDGPAVQLGEHQVEDDERRSVALDRVKRRRPIRRGHDAEPVAFQVRPDQPDDLGVIVDDEDRSGGDGAVARSGRHGQHGRTRLGARRVDQVTGRR